MAPGSVELLRRNRGGKNGPRSFTSSCVVCYVTALVYGTVCMATETLKQILYSLCYDLIVRANRAKTVFRVEYIDSVCTVYLGK